MASNFDIGFRVEGKKALLLRGKNKTELPRETVVEIYQLVLGRLSPNRDYNNVTSLQKLLKIIDLECEPDESDESDDEKVVPARKSTTVARSGASTKKAPVKEAPVVKKRPAAHTVRKTPVKEESDDDESESDDESDDEESE